MYMDQEDVYRKGLEKVTRMEKNFGGDFPHITEKGKWLTNTNGHWTGGFWTALLWLRALHQPGNGALKTVALQQARKLEIRTKDNKTHDMGFIFGPSCVFGNHIVPDEHLVRMALAGAHNLETLYEEKVRLCLAWDEPGYEGTAIVDTIMNLPIMVWAAQYEGNRSMRNKAIAAANRIMEVHLRNDYSTYHVVRWDTRIFEITQQTTHQGFSADTCWSRGQAWALYGFANMFRYTAIPEYLQTSQGLAACFWDNLDSESYLPKWDFSFRNNHQEPIDAAAASIAASGMVLLSKILKENNQPRESLLWKERGNTIVESLVQHCFDPGGDEYGLIRNVTVDKPRNSGINESSMYGDYYFMEALYRLINYDNNEALAILY